MNKEMLLSEMFERHLNLNFKEVDPYDVEYFIERNGDELLIDFKWTNNIRKWLINFQFFKKPYKDMERTWYAHNGFLKCFKTVEPYIAIAVGDPTIKKVRIVGYSHGGALAMLAHEFIWFHRPDLRDNLETYAFGAPKVFSGRKIPDELKERWEDFYVVRVKNDIVSYLPPWPIYTHVGNQIVLESDVKNPIKAHYPEVYLDALKKWEKENTMVTELFIRVEDIPPRYKKVIVKSIN